MGDELGAQPAGAGRAARRLSRAPALGVHLRQHEPAQAPAQQDHSVLTRRPTWMRVDRTASFTCVSVCANPCGSSRPHRAGSSPSWRRPVTAGGHRRLLARCTAVRRRWRRGRPTPRIQAARCVLGSRPGLSARVGRQPPAHSAGITTSSCAGWVGTTSSRVPSHPTCLASRGRPRPPRPVPPAGEVVREPLSLSYRLARARRTSPRDASPGPDEASPPTSRLSGRAPRPLGQPNECCTGVVVVVTRRIEQPWACSSRARSTPTSGTRSRTGNPSHRRRHPRARPTSSTWFSTTSASRR